MSIIIHNILETNKRYMFINRYNTNKALKVWYSSGYPAGNTSNVCLAERNEFDPGQQWVIVKSGNNYILQPQASNSKALDLFTGSGTGSNENAHIYTPSNTSYLTFTRCDDRHDAVKIQLAGPTNTNYYLVANTSGDGTRTGKSSSSVGNVYFSASKNATKGDWIVIDLDDYEINGLHLPLDDYPVRSYWTNDGNPTNSSGANSIVLSDGSKQCAGFAKYVYKILWGSYNAGHAVPNEITLTGNKSDFDDIGRGARINCRGDGANNHSMILLDKNDYGVAIYDVNWDNKCGVDIRTYSYPEFKATMERIKTSSYTP